MSKDGVWEDILATKSRTNVLKSKIEERKRARERTLQTLAGTTTGEHAAQSQPVQGAAILSHSDAGKGDSASESTSKEPAGVVSERRSKMREQGSSSGSRVTSSADHQTKIGENLTAHEKDSRESIRMETSGSNVSSSGKMPFEGYTAVSGVEVEQCLLTVLRGLNELPVEFGRLCTLVDKACEGRKGDGNSKVSEKSGAQPCIPEGCVSNLLGKFYAQELITLKKSNSGGAGDAEDPAPIVTSVDAQKISSMLEEKSRIPRSLKRSQPAVSDDSRKPKVKKTGAASDQLNLQDLLAAKTAKEKTSTEFSDTIRELLNKPTAKDKYLTETFKSQSGAAVQEFCPHGTKAECKRMSTTRCSKVHFIKLINSHTDSSLGDCSFLNTCFHMDTCKFVHYKVDQSDLQTAEAGSSTALVKKADKPSENVAMMPAQWVQCDLRTFDMSVLGKFAVVMADPPWDIHMELPYGTMKDNEMMNLNVPTLQDDGYIFLWVTIRAMELGRDCLDKWGYTRCDELIWVKTNQLQRLIRTGRTGHWFNHGKEHCLVGVKGNPKTANRGLDCDVIVAEVRATSHKPDEIYGIIERLSPGTRKIELFGRPHNTQPNWLTLGNQVDGVSLHEEAVIDNFKRKYPDGNCLGETSTE